MVNTGWGFEDEEQKAKMLEEVTKNNCSEKLRLVREVEKMPRVELARVLGVSESTLRRLESEQSEATDEFMRRLQALCAIGRAKFDALKDADKEKISEYVGTAGGVATGIGASVAAISASGAVGGLSAAGITSGLAAIGGGMLAGVGVVAAIPVATGILGYGLIKGIKAICEANNLKSQEVDGHWEIRKEPPENE